MFRMALSVFFEGFRALGGVSGSGLLLRFVRF